MRIFYATLFEYKFSVVYPFKGDWFVVNKSFLIGKGSIFCIINTALNAEKYCLAMFLKHIWFDETKFNMC